MKAVIVGGVAGGASAAARIRRLDEHAQIIMIERSGYVSYANCGLPYYVGGVIKEQEELTLQTPESFWEDLPCDGNATLLDVRTEGEYRRGHLNGFRNIPLDDLRESNNFIVEILRVSLLNRSIIFINNDYWSLIIM